MTFSPRSMVSWLTLLTGLAGGACAHAAPVPTVTMARAASELHVAEQAGANHAAESRALWLGAEAALEEARSHVFRGRHGAARGAAERAIHLAHRARELSALRAPDQSVTGTASMTLTGLAGLGP